MAKKKNFWEQVADVASRSFDQVNPFDNGKSWNNRTGNAPAPPVRYTTPNVIPAPRFQPLQVRQAQQQAAFSPAPAPVQPAPQPAPFSMPVDQNPIRRPVVVERPRVAPKPSPISQATKAVVDAVTLAPKVAGEGLAYVNPNGAVAQANQAQANLQSQQTRVIAQAGQKLRDASTSPEEKARWQRLLDVTKAQSQDTSTQLRNRTARQQEISDPTKQLAAYGSMAFDVATLPISVGGGIAIRTAGKEAADRFSKKVGQELAQKMATGNMDDAARAAAVKTAQLTASTGARKEAGRAMIREMAGQGKKMAAITAPAGTIHPFVENGQNTRVEDVVLSTAAAAALGFVLPAGMYGAGRAIAGTVRGLDKVMNMALSRLGDSPDRILAKLPPERQAVVTTRMNEIQATIDQLQKTLDLEKARPRVSGQRKPTFEEEMEYAYRLMDEYTAVAEQSRRLARRIPVYGENQVADSSTAAFIKNISTRLADPSIPNPSRRGAVQDINPYDGNRVKELQRSIDELNEARITEFEQMTQPQAAGFLALPKSVGFDDAVKNKETFDIFGGKAYEVSDEGFQLKAPISDTTSRTTTIGEIIDHPLLFEKYPHLRDMKLLIKHEPPRPAPGGKMRILLGSFNPESKEMFMNSALPVRSRVETLMHELSHAIDDFEGYPQGGSANAAYLKKVVDDRIAREVKDLTKQLTDVQKKINATGKDALKPAALAKAQAKAADIERQINFTQTAEHRSDTQFHAYQDLGGENKANTQANRFGMTDEQRAARPFTADYARDPKQGVLRVDKPADEAWMTGRPPAQETDYSNVVAKVGKNAPAPSNTTEYIHPTLAPTAKIPGTNKSVGQRKIRAGIQDEATPEEMIPIKEAINKASKAGAKARAATEESVKSKITAMQKVKDFIQENFTDDTSFFQALDRKISGRNWFLRVNERSADERLDPMIQAFRNSKAVQRQRYDDLGIMTFAKKLTNQKTYDAYRIYRTFRTNAERAMKNTKRNENLHQAYARFTGGRKYSEDEYLFKQLSQDKKFDKLFQEENQIARRILRERGDNPNFTLSRLEAEQIIEEYPNFTPQYRAMSEDLIQMRKGTNVGSQQGKNVKILKEGSTTKQLEDPLTNLREYSDELVSKSIGNDIMNLLLKQFPEKFRAVVSVDQILAKEKAVIRMAELGATGRAVMMGLRRNSVVARALMKELRELNNEGLKASLGKTPKQSPTRPVKTVTIKTIKEQIIENAPKNMDGLTQSYAVKAKLNKVYTKNGKGINDMALDIHHGGWTKLAQLTGVSKATAKSIAEQVLKAPTINGAKITVKEGAIGRAPTLNQMIEDLINKRPADVQRIVNKIKVRDERLNAVMDDILALAQRADDIKAERFGIMRSGDLDAFEKAAGKNTRRRVVDNREEIYEVLDPRLAKHLDNLSGHQLSAAAEKLGVPTRVFKFLTTGPGNFIAFVPVAIIRDVVAAILFAKAPLRTAFDPRSYIDAIAVAARKGDFYKQLQRHAISGTMAEADRPTRTISSDAMRNPGWKRPVVWAKHPRQAFRDLEEIDMAFERFTRGRMAAARYRQQLEKYKNDPNLTEKQAKEKAYWDAAEEFRESALNFGRSGAVTRELNSVAAYLNPAVQAGNKVRKSIIDSPIGFIARASTATTLVWGAYAISTDTEEKKKVYDAINPEEKLTNLIIVLDGATFDEDKGVTTGGVWKFPLPYEFRPFTTGVLQAVDKQSPEEYGNFLLSGIAFMTGLETRNFSAIANQFMPTQARPFIENLTNWSFYRDAQLTPDYMKESTNGDKTLQSTSASSGTAKAISRATGGAASPIEVDNIASGIFGGATRDIMAGSDAVLNTAGIVPNDEKTESNPFKRLEKRMTQAYGESNAVAFFKRLEGKRKTIKDEDDRKAFDLLHSKDPTPGMLDNAEKATHFLNRPDVVRAERELDAENRKAGQPGNPLFDLTDEQLKKVMVYRQAKMLNAGKQTYDKNGNSLFTSLGLDEGWYETFRDNESKFYDTLRANKAKREGKSDQEVAAILRGEADEGEYKTFSGAVKPEASPELQKLLDSYYALPKGTGARSAMLKAYPEILEYWELNDGFTNKERKAIGLKPLEEDSGFGGSGSGGGGGGGRRGGGTVKTASVGSGVKAPSSKAEGKSRTITVKKRTPKKITVTRSGRV